MGNMSKVGEAVLPLHGGKAPSYLVSRMKRMADAVAYLIVNEYGTQTFLKRISDPLWFQALGSALGYDWHSSGVTTVLTGVLREVLSLDKHGLMVIGGKGSQMRLVPNEIQAMADVGLISGSAEAELIRASRLVAKVDTAAVQSGYQLYHHAVFVDERGHWAIVQQGMNETDRTARRYHWIETDQFVDSPPENVIGIPRSSVLNLVEHESAGVRKATLDVVKEPTEKLRSVIESSEHATLDSFSVGNPSGKAGAEVVVFPRRVDWQAVKALYEHPPARFEDLLLTPGIGPAAVRALALLSSLIYGERPSWRDPIKFSFAVGGKDGVPYPVDRKAYDEAIREMEEVARQARLTDDDKTWMLKRLSRFASEGLHRCLACSAMCGTL